LRRETLLSAVPPPDAKWPGLIPLLNRAYALLPSAPSVPSVPSVPTAPAPPNTSTHLLHLAPHGEILPHIDNLEASGSIIVGLSLGAERILRLEHKETGGGWDVRLGSGSVYVQRDRVRYEYKHSVLPYGDRSAWDGEELEAGHRVSIMIRDAPANATSL